MKIPLKLIGLLFVALGAASIPEWSLAQATEKPHASGQHQSALPHCQEAKAGGPEEVVRLLYKQYPWDGAVIENAPKKVLSKFFDRKLTELLVKNRQCEEIRHETCSIDSSVMYAAQGGDITDIRVCAMDSENKVVNVQLRINSDPQVVLYKLARTDAGWRISDVLYPDVPTNQSLVEVLSRDFGR